MERVVAHVDLNNFYASVEVLHHPRLRGHPVAVGGDPDQRHGIILAKNYEAKKFDIQVGMALWQARQRCPGLILHSFANGLDSSPVAQWGSESAIKSIGNSTTTPRDLENEHDCKIVFYNLAESVAERLRELGMKSRTVKISLRDNSLNWFERQMTLPHPTCLASELCQRAMTLLRENYSFEKPLRSIGIRATNLEPDCDVQCSLFEDETQRQKREILERTLDVIRRRFGHHVVETALMKLDNRLGKLDAKAEHIIHPVGYF